MADQRLAEAQEYLPKFAQFGFRYRRAIEFPNGELYLLFTHESDGHPLTAPVEPAADGGPPLIPADTLPRLLGKAEWIAQRKIVRYFPGRSLPRGGST